MKCFAVISKTLISFTLILNLSLMVVSHHVYAYFASVRKESRYVFIRLSHKNFITLLRSFEENNYLKTIHDENFFL